jgi:N-acetylglutamate synthase-like GNAT family acetyltransferase
VRVRDATTEDTAAIERLLTQLGYPVRADSVVARLSRLRRAGDRVVVADVDGQIAGLAHLQVLPAIEYDAPTARLAALVVDKNRRRTGVGAALVEAMEAEARFRGCALLFLTTAEHRADAHVFYERLGFERTGRRYAKRFGD